MSGPHAILSVGGAETGGGAPPASDCPELWSCGRKVSQPPVPLEEGQLSQGPGAASSPGRRAERLTSCLGLHRANALEEQLKEQELRACEMILEETRKQKELLCKMEREKSIEIENLQAR